jgi:hypothetical protein
VLIRVKYSYQFVLGGFKMAVKKIGMTSLEKDIYSVVGSVGLLAGNIALGGFIPFGNLIPIALTSITGGVFFDNLLNNKWEKVFSKLGICNSDGVYPKKLHEFKTENETKYIFKLPDRLTINSLMNCQDAIETYMHKSIQIKSTKNFYAEVTVFEKPNINYFWYNFFKTCGISNKEGEQPQFVKIEETQIGYKHIFKLPLGMCIEMFEKIKPLIQSAINKPIKLNLTKDNLLIIQEYQIQYSDFYTPKYSLTQKIKKDKKINYIDLMQDEHIVNNDLVFPIGVTLTENGQELTYIDLTDDPHILVAGLNGTGKTSLVLCLLTAMILKEIELVILDLKAGGDYTVFKKYKNLTSYTIDVPEAKTEIVKIRKEMERRYKLLNETNCKNHTVYNKKFKDNPMKPMVVVIEEYYMLNTQGNKIDDELNQLLAKSRACNIKFIIVLQRPCQENLKPKLKANLNHTIGFYVNNTYNSGIVLGEGDSRLFTDLHGKGEAIILDMYQDKAFKSFYLEDSDIERIIKSKCIAHKKPIKQTIIEEKTTPIETSNPKSEGKVIPFYVNKNTV